MLDLTNQDKIDLLWCLDRCISWYEKHKEDHDGDAAARERYNQEMARLYVLKEKVTRA